MSGHFDEAFVERQIVSDGILPALFVVAVVGEVLHDEFVDAVESQSLLRAGTDGHHDEGVVTEGRLLILLHLFRFFAFTTRTALVFAAAVVVIVIAFVIATFVRPRRGFTFG